MRRSLSKVMACLVLALGGTAGATEVPTSAVGHAFNPTWSKDGRWLAFEINDYEGTNDLYVVEVASGEARGSAQKVILPGARSSFAGDSSVAGAAVWHPQGALIFEGSNSGGTTRLFLLSPGTQGAGELIPSSLIRGDLSWPDVSPDGARVMFVSDATGDGDVYVWDRKTNAVTKTLASPFSEMAPNFDADGVRVAYSRKNRGGEDLFVLENAMPRPWVGGNGDQSRPDWAGNTLVFFSNERGEGQWDIAASNTVGRKTIVAKDIRLPLRATPHVSMDSQWVLYGVSAPEKSDKVYMTHIDGSKTIAIETRLEAAGEPALVEAGGRTFLAFTALPQEGADWRQLHILEITNQMP